MSSLCSLFTKLSSFFSSPAGLWAIKINNIIKLSQVFSQRIRICQTISVHRERRRVKIRVVVLNDSSLGKDIQLEMQTGRGLSLNKLRKNHKL